MNRFIRPFVFLILPTMALFGTAAPGAEDDDLGVDDKPMSSSTFAGLKWRSIGPALMSGRICDFAVNPNNHSEYFVAVCSGGVWKTENAGTTWTPVFDKQGSYSIGCVALDPNNPHVVWVGTGENNSQRSVSFGNGVYRSRDGGKHWENLGLGESEHIGMILLDPRDSNTAFVAAQGPLWRSGGDRGLYKTTDGGRTWNRVLHIGEDTGVNEVHMDPRDPDILYASAYQRRRHVWTLIDGGPESAIYKSTDGGANWRKIEHGIPDVDKGRIGMCVSPADPDVVYAIIEAADDKGGVFRSTDRGETWERRNKYVASSPQYYNELVCDPMDVARFYLLDTVLRVTNDGGKTIERMPRKYRHVDDHALWIDPSNTRHLLIGCDGGIYETFDLGENWDYKPNLPVTQFYRVAVDNALPFYYVYGGTQDNNTQGGPSRTTSRAGITNEDWFVTVSGDGFGTAIDPEDPFIVYSQSQHGGLVRHDRRSGEIVDIKPREAPSEEPYRWNWDSPLIISPHNHKRLYFGANKLFRSDDQGDSWTVISGDLSRGLDRNALEVMGRIQEADAVSKNRSTSIYGNTVALTESPLVEGLLYVGTDDGLIHVTKDGGASWRKISVFPHVPDMTYVSFLAASPHDADTIFAAFDNHKQGDFAPYLLKSTDRGQNWESISGDLPYKQIVYAVAQDHSKPELLFAGTEFGFFFSADTGKHWVQLKGGIPTISVHDFALQEREDDIVLATFGRGFYILDDYAALRLVDEQTLEREAVLFPVKDAWQYNPRSRLGGWSGRGSQGASFYAADNPPFGATFTYYLKDKLTTRRERRKEAEKKARKAGKTAKYPSIDELRAEDEEKEPTVVLEVKAEDGNVVRRITGSRKKGMHRVSWDLRLPASTPIDLRPQKDLLPWMRSPVGPMVAPGTYFVELTKNVDGVVTSLSEPLSFQVIPLEQATFAAENRAALLAFRKKAARLRRAVRGAIKVADEAQVRLNHIRKAVVETPDADHALVAETEALQSRLTELLNELRGDRTLADREEPVPMSIRRRIESITSNQWYVSSAPTKTQRDGYRYAADSFARVLTELKSLVNTDLRSLETKLDEAGAPWTPGRFPVWEME